MLKLFLLGNHCIFSAAGPWSQRAIALVSVSTLTPACRCWLVGWLCLTSHRQRGHLETAPPFTVPCEGCEAR